jgi:hypothetical protein
LASIWKGKGKKGKAAVPVLLNSAAAALTEISFEVNFNCNESEGKKKNTII